MSDQQTQPTLVRVIEEVVLGSHVLATSLLEFQESGVFCVLGGEFFHVLIEFPIPGLVAGVQIDQVADESSLRHGVQSVHEDSSNQDGQHCNGLG